jgi:tRNA uridine 5-carboxymethylaminomethyl modification enzyme
LVAGINASRSEKSLDPFVLSRVDGYIGVLADDLVTKGTDEPYRMFTSRAEYRLLQREDNADLRLSELGHQLGLLSEENYSQVLRKKEGLAKARQALENFYFYPRAETQARLIARGTSPLKDRTSAEALLRRPELDWRALIDLGFDAALLPEEIAEQAEIHTKYQGYIQRDLDLLEGVRKSELVRLPLEMDFESIPGLSTEIKARLKLARPETLGQASRLQGITPAAVANLMIHLKMRESS